MSEPRLNGIWWKIFAALVVPVALGLVGYGALKEQVRNVRNDVQTRAPREVVEAQQSAILRELQAINSRLDRMERRP